MYSQEKIYLESLLIKLQVWKFAMQLYQKETPTQVFSCEYCKDFKKTYFEQYLRVAASVQHFSLFEKEIRASILNIGKPINAHSWRGKAYTICKSAKFRTLQVFTHHWYASYTPVRLRALPIIITCQRLALTFISRSATRLCLALCCVAFFII